VSGGAVRIDGLFGEVVCAAAGDDEGGPAITETTSQILGLISVLCCRRVWKNRQGGDQRKRDILVA